MNTCELCHREIAGWQTFGAIGTSLCYQCFKDTNEDQCYSWYGLGPHEHDLARSGSIIASTVFLSLPMGVKQPDGWYEIEPGIFFRPDPDVDGLGIWEKRNL